MRFLDLAPLLNAERATDSTLIVLSGYTFGLERGFLLSYAAALSGAVCVYQFSRWKLRQSMIAWLSRSPKLAKVVKAVSIRPRLLFLIRLGELRFVLSQGSIAHRIFKRPILTMS